LLGDGVIELASDTYIQAQRIRRERISKRPKQAAGDIVDIAEGVQETHSSGI